MQDPARSLGAGCVRCQGRYPRGPRLDVLWSSLPKRERVLLRRYGRKVRSDRGDCQIGPLRRRSCKTEVKHYKVETNGIRMHVAEKGRGPLVVLCHGFPESWYSWRHQLRALADAGFRAVAPDITLSGDGPDGAHDTVPRGKGFLSRLSNPSALPAGSVKQTSTSMQESSSGQGSYYRNVDANWELLAPFDGAQVVVPALYIAGDRDLVVKLKGMDQLLPNLSKFVPKLRRQVMLPGCGHWTQQERVAEVNDAIISFLKEL